MDCIDDYDRVLCMKSEKNGLKPDPAKVRAVLAKNVRRYRKEAEMTQSDVAREARLELSTVLRVEHAKFDSTLATIARIRRALGIPWEKLLNGIV
jgi:DNA-binding XRE family transcriptional regulator